MLIRVITARRPKEYLDYAAAASLSDLPWYETHFPEELELRHTVQAYALLQKERNGVA
jgi:hypothetical protein